MADAAPIPTRVTVDQLRANDVAAGSDQCRVCGCTDNVGCQGGCIWSEPGLCSSCVHVDLSEREGALVLAELLHPRGCCVTFPTPAGGSETYRLAEVVEALRKVMSGSGAVPYASHADHPAP